MIGVTQTTGTIQWVFNETQACGTFQFYLASAWVDVTHAVVAFAQVDSGIDTYTFTDLEPNIAYHAELTPIYDLGYGTSVSTPFSTLP